MPNPSDEQAAGDIPDELVSYFCILEHEWDEPGEESTYCTNCGITRRQAAEVVALVAAVREGHTILRHLCHEEGCAARYDSDGNHVVTAFDWDIPQDSPKCDCGMAESLAAYLAAKAKVLQWLQEKTDA